MWEFRQWPTRRGSLAAVGLLPKKNGHRVVALYCTICSKDAELWPMGSIKGKIIKLNRGAVPCGCSASTSWAPWQKKLLATRAAAAAGLEILRFSGGSVQVRCAQHGVFDKTLKSLFSKETGCAACWYDSLRLPESELSARIKLREAESGLTVVSVKDGRLAIRCPEHGLYDASPDTFIRQRCGCPSCSSGGFKPQSPALVYVLASECGGYAKVGISGDLPKRLQKLATVTPFGFRLDCFRALPGAEARKLEKSAHRAFMTAGFSGFDGSTEWLRSDPSIRSFVLSTSGF